MGTEARVLTRRETKGATEEDKGQRREDHHPQPRRRVEKRRNNDLHRGGGGMSGVLRWPPPALEDAACMQGSPRRPKRGRGRRACTRVRAPAAAAENGSGAEPLCTSVVDTHCRFPHGPTGRRDSLAAITTATSTQDLLLGRTRIERDGT